MGCDRTHEDRWFQVWWRVWTWLFGGVVEIVICLTQGKVVWLWWKDVGGEWSSIVGYVYWCNNSKAGKWIMRLIERYIAWYRFVLEKSSKLSIYCFDVLEFYFLGESPNYLYTFQVPWFESLGTNVSSWTAFRVTFMMIQKVLRDILHWRFTLSPIGFRTPIPLKRAQHISVIIPRGIIKTS